MVPRPADDATWTVVPAPATLIGEADSTWINAACENVGSATAMPSRLNFHLDGAAWVTATSGPSIRARGTAPYNYGPFNVRGGRHVIRVTADALDAVTESDETNNVYAAQWCWQGDPLPPHDERRRAPPRPGSTRTTSTRPFPGTTATACASCRRRRSTGAPSGASAWPPAATSTCCACIRPPTAPPPPSAPTTGPPGSRSASSRRCSSTSTPSAAAPGTWASSASPSRPWTTGSATPTRARIPSTSASIPRRPTSSRALGMFQFHVGRRRPGAGHPRGPDRSRGRPGAHGVAGSRLRPRGPART